MPELANRMIALARGVTGIDASVDDDSPAAVLARIGETRLRVGLWPLVCAEKPQAALGVMALLGCLLERWRNVTVYRVFVRLDEQTDPDEYEWQIADSQFDVDDWQVDGLDENVAVWGALNRAESQWRLAIELENDLSDDNATVRLNDVAQSLTGIVAQLPQIAAAIADRLDAEAERAHMPVYAPGEWNEARLESLLARTFDWEKRIALHLWRGDWSQEQLLEDAALLLDAAQMCGELGAWTVSSAVARALLPALEHNSEVLLPLAQRIVAAFPDTPVPAVILALAFFNRNHETEPMDWLEQAVDAHPESSVARAALVELYGRAQRVQDAVDALQSAIEDDVADAALYLRYADLLVLFHRSGLVVPRFILVEAEDRQLSAMLDEAIAAYDAVLEEQPDNLEAMSRRLLILVDNAGFWETLERLIQADETGDYVRAVVDNFQLLQDPTPAIELFERAIEAHPTRYDLHVNLAVTLLAADEPDAAAEHLELAEELTGDDAAIADIERLYLAASDPDFEMRIGDITDLLNAGRQASLSDIDYLEETIEQAQTFTQGYLLLARAYQGRGESGAALETLLDGQKYLPEDAEIAEMLVRMLWQTGEHDLAFEYLNAGLRHNPDYVPLLALTGRYLFEDGQAEEARIFLARAESLNPRNPVLREVQRYIAGLHQD